MKSLWDRRIPVLGCILVALGLVLWWDPLLFHPIATACLGLTAGACLALAGLSTRTIPTHVNLLSFLLLVVTVLSAAGSGYPWNGVQYAVMLGGVCALWQLFSGLEPERLGRGLIWFYGLMALAVLVPLLLQYGRQFVLFGYFGLLHVPNGSFRNPNVLARVLGLAGLVLVVADDLKTRWRWLSVLPLAACVWTGSRGAILALTGGLSWLVWSRYRNRIRRTWVVVGLGVLVVLVLVLVGDPSALTNLQRIQLVPESLSMWWGRPLLGVGGWNFGLVYPDVSADGRWQRHPHSLPLLVLTEFGAAGLVVFVAALGIGYREHRRNAQSDAVVALAVFLGLHELVDTMVWIPGVLLWSVPVLAWMSTSGKRERAGAPRWKPLAYGVLLVMLSALVLVVDGTVSRGVRATREGNFERARRSLWEHVSGVGSVHRALANVRRHRDRRALKDLMEANHLNRYDPYYPFLLARALRGQGRDMAARRARKEAFRRDPHDMLRMRSGTMDARRDTSTLDPSDTEPLRADRLHEQPDRARWYLPLVDRSIRKGETRKALRQIAALRRFDKVSWTTRVRLVARLARCYRIRGNQSAVQRAERRLDQLMAVRDRVRPQFHRFFYRRMGHDHAFLQQ